MDKPSPTITTNSDVPKAIIALCENGWHLTRSDANRLIFERCPTEVYRQDAAKAFMQDCQKDEENDCAH